MKIVVIGGSGRIGRKLVYNLRQDDRRVLQASPSFGVDTVSGYGLDEALQGAQVVVDVSNAPSVEGDAPLRFFEASGRRLLSAGRTAGIAHHIALSIVGTDRLQASRYFQAKKLQEDLIKASGLSFSILRATQSFDLLADVVQAGGATDVVLSPARVQPLSGEDVAEALADLATGAPLQGIAEVAGPEPLRLPHLAAAVLTAHEDGRQIVADPHARYFGAELRDDSLLPGRGARLASLRFEEWLRDSLQPRVALSQEV